MAAGTLSLDVEHAKEDEAIVARCPTIVATYWRLRRGEQPLAPRSDLGHAANFLYMMPFGYSIPSSTTRGLPVFGTSQIFFPGEPLNEKDLLLNAVPDKDVRERLIFEYTDAVMRLLIEHGADLSEWNQEAERIEAACS